MEKMNIMFQPNLKKKQPHPISPKPNIKKEVPNYLKQDIPMMDLDAL